VNQFVTLPDGSYKYDTVQFAFNKRFGSGLFIQSSYDYQWRNELRRADSISGSPLNSDPLAVGFFFNPNPSIDNRQKTTNWQGRLIARYVLKGDVGVSSNLRVQSGFGYSRVISATLPKAGTLQFFSENNDNTRSDTVPILDLRADKAFRIGRYKFTAMADVYNVTNSNAVTNFTLTNGTSYNKIIATLDPRVLQFGVRFDF
jgi:outer membrane receptor protein involved in Fe transport